MKKLIKFQPNAKTFFGIAEDKYDEGDYPSAVYYFYQSYLKNNDIASLVALGETYADMGDPERGLKYLFLALDRAPDDPDIRESIAECFLDLNEEETAFFYFRPRMSARHFKQIMDDCDRDNEFLPPSPIRVLEKDDNVPLSIALKLLQSGDMAYAKEILLTIKPESEHFGSACNLLSLTALDSGEPEKALEYAEKSLAKKDNIDARCDMMMAYHALGDAENAQKAADAIERLKPKPEEHKTAAFAYIKTGKPEMAVKYLRAIYDSGGISRDAIISYALVLNETGEKEKARQIMIKAGKMFPDDVTVNVLASEMAAGRQTGLYPFLDGELAKTFAGEIDEKIELIRERGSDPFWDGKDGKDDKEDNDGKDGKDGLAKGRDGTKARESQTDSLDGERDFFDDADFKKKIRWLFQTRLSGSQSRAAMALGLHKRWHSFLCELLLDNNLEPPVKKTCLFMLLGAGGVKKTGMVLDGLYIRLKPRYPEGMDGRFRAAYCLAFATYAFSDHDFEGRLYSSANRILKEYQKCSDMFSSDNVLAAVIFFATGHCKISDPAKCAHLFGCEADLMKKYMKHLGIGKP